MAIETATTSKEVTFRATRNDYIRYYNRSYRLFSFKPVNILRALIFPAICLYLIASMSFVLRLVIPNFYVLFAVFFFGNRAISYAQYLAFAFRDAGNSAAVPGVRRLTASPNSLIMEAEGARSEYWWSSIDAVASDSSYTYITGHTGVALFVPKRAFGSATEGTDFVAYLQQMRNEHGSEPVRMGLHHTQDAPVTFTYRHTLDTIIDTLRITLPLTRHTLVTRLSALALFLLPLIVGLVLEWNSLLMDNSLRPLAPYAVVSFVITASVLRTLTSRYQAQQAVKDSKVLSPNTLIARSDGLTIQSYAGVFTYNWSRVRTVSAGPTGLLIQFAPPAAILVPLAAFVSAGDLSKCAVALNNLRDGLEAGIEISGGGDGQVWPPAPTSFSMR